MEENKTVRTDTGLQILNNSKVLFTYLSAKNERSQEGFIIITDTRLFLCSNEIRLNGNKPSNIPDKYDYGWTYSIKFDSNNNRIVHLHNVNINTTLKTDTKDKTISIIGSKILDSKFSFLRQYDCTNLYFKNNYICSISINGFDFCCGSQIITITSSKNLRKTTDILIEDLKNDPEFYSIISSILWLFNHLGLKMGTFGNKMHYNYNIIVPKDLEYLFINPKYQLISTNSKHSHFINT